jgi:hypothetical protein
MGHSCGFLEVRSEEKRGSSVVVCFTMDGSGSLKPQTQVKIRCSWVSDEEEEEGEEEEEVVGWKTLTVRVQKDPPSNVGVTRYIKGISTLPGLRNCACTA